ncbi:hypothetical protein [Desertivirga xinjiangensis]|uniref:hypothetical protein n=1 Tax=Desertivirga xinjiangensis TaxID=539206 RepID=UPI00210E2FBA|nr:hypothetical protein [Pedobacter xinjiangensis]
MEATSRTRMNTDQPNDWIEFIKWGIAWVSGSFATMFSFNKFIDRYFDYKLKQQAKFIEDVVERKVSPEISELKNAIDELREAIWALKNK